MLGIWMKSILREYYSNSTQYSKAVKVTTQDWNYYDIHENVKVYPNQVMATISRSLYRNVRTGCSEKSIWIYHWRLTTGRRTVPRWSDLTIKQHAYAWQVCDMTFTTYACLPKLPKCIFELFSFKNCVALIMVIFVKAFLPPSPMHIQRISGMDHRYFKIISVWITKLYPQRFVHPFILNYNSHRKSFISKVTIVSIQFRYRIFACH